MVRWLDSGIGHMIEMAKPEIQSPRERVENDPFQVDFAADVVVVVLVVCNVAVGWVVSNASVHHQVGYQGEEVEG